jgi:hypothetical protein
MDCADTVGCADTDGFISVAGCAGAGFAFSGATAPTLIDTFFFLFVSFIIKIKNNLASDSFKTFFEPYDNLSNARAAHAPDSGCSLNSSRYYTLGSPMSIQAAGHRCRFLAALVKKALPFACLLVLSDSWYLDRAPSRVTVPLERLDQGP